MRHDTLIIGGGLAGLTTAVGLSEAGLSAVVLEADAQCGGRASSYLDARTGDVIDIGPHVLTTEHRNMLALLGRLGTDSDVLWQPDKFITLINNGRALEMRNFNLPAPLHFLPNFFHVPSLSLLDVYSARRVLLRVMRLTEEDVIRYDRRNGLEVMREFGVSRRFIDWFWRTVCMSILNVPLERCSAGALLRFLRIMAGRRDFYFGFPTRGLGELFVPGAIKRIQRCGGEVRHGVRVQSLWIESGRCRGAILDDGTRVEARNCVSAVPPAVLRSLLPEEVLAQHPVLAQLDSFKPSRYVSTYLWFNRKLTDQRFWARIWQRDNLNYDFYDLSNIRPSWKGRASVIASNIIHDERVHHWDDESIVAATLDELGEFLPAANTQALRHARVHRIPMAIPAPHPGSESMRPGTRTSIESFYLAGDWINTHLPASMESAARSGWLAAEAIAAEHGRDLQIAMPLRPMQGITRWYWERCNATN